MLTLEHNWNPIISQFKPQRYILYITRKEFCQNCHQAYFPVTTYFCEIDEELAILPLTLTLRCLTSVLFRDQVGRL